MFSDYFTYFVVVNRFLFQSNKNKIYTNKKWIEMACQDFFGVGRPRQWINMGKKRKKKSDDERNSVSLLHLLLLLRLRMIIYLRVFFDENSLFQTINCQIGIRQMAIGITACYRYNNHYNLVYAQYQINARRGYPIHCKSNHM